MIDRHHSVILYTMGGLNKVKIHYRFGLLLIVVFVFSALSSAQGAVGNKVDDEAPDFTLPNTDNEFITLSDHRGSENVIVIFYRGVF